MSIHLPPSTHEAPVLHLSVRWKSHTPTHDLCALVEVARSFHPSTTIDLAMAVFFGTFNPALRQILSTRIWFTSKPSLSKRPVIRGVPWRPYLEESSTIRPVNAFSSSRNCGVYCWTVSAFPNTRHARRSLTFNSRRTCSTVARSCVGLKSFAKSKLGLPREESPGPTPPPQTSALTVLSPAQSAWSVWLSRLHPCVLFAPSIVYHFLHAQNPAHRCHRGSLA